MTAYTLHLPDDRGFSRWILAALLILLAHLAIVTSIALWYARRPAESNIVPAIAVTVAPVDASSPERQDQDIAVGPTMQQAEEAPRQLPKERQAEKTEQPPPPQQQADITLPREAPKEIETPKPQVQPPAPETRAPPKTEHIGQFTQASADAYNALVFGHLQRFKRYPSAAHGAAGTVVVQFALDRDGEVVTSVVTKSSGNSALDREAIETLRRASPFPVFPAAKPGAQDSFLAPVSFAR
ncbi:energy transducer TonB [Bradyrhizobium sp. CCGUVB23]|uniref:energy transducer TonB n=1 Tax=Bradyrhizobium sp. CCGUVB23 TaxID=2949630 RepID=UPI0020B22FD1|nr:energy transducer TonB [Bradyrhizobium sp. CCGUVB23]MCP3460357.1 energy transducer TonB [Bradyrhizobium sp. CCGUVB23]